MTDDHEPTPPLEEFLTRYRIDDNEWWRLSCGHHQNLFDAAVEAAAFKTVEAAIGKYTRREKALLAQQYEVECLLAEALGYDFTAHAGWVIGDHTIVTLAMEVHRRFLNKDALEISETDVPPGEPGDLTRLDAAVNAAVVARMATERCGDFPAPCNCNDPTTHNGH